MGKETTRNLHVKNGHPSHPAAQSTITTFKQKMIPSEIQSCFG